MTSKLFKKGFDFFKKNNFSQAEHYFSQISPQDINYPNSINMLGVIAYINKNYDTALQYYNQAVALKPNYAGAWLNKAILFQELNQFNKSLNCYDKAIKFEQNYIEAWHQKGALLERLKKYEEAVIHFDKAIQRNLNVKNFLFAKGCMLKNLYKYRDSNNCFNEVIKIDPKFAEAYLNLGLNFYHLNNSSEAIRYYDISLNYNSNLAEAWLNKGVILRERRFFDKAIDHYNKAIQIKKNYSEAWANKGVVLGDMKKYEEAIKNYNKAIKYKPNNAEAWCNKGVAFNHLNNFIDAIKSYNKALKINSNHYSSQYNKSLTCLILGKFNKGWELYETRWKRKNSQKYKYKDIPELKSLNEVLNKKILIWFEQGLGDTIQFSRYIPLLHKLGGVITFETQNSLKNLFDKQLNCDVKCKIDASDNFDYQIPTMSLPKLFKTDAGNVPPPINIKIVKGQDNTKIQNKNFTEKRLKIGIAVSGNRDHLGDSLRSMPLDKISPLLRYGNFHLIQNNINDKDQKFYKKKKEIIFCGNQSLDEIVKVIESMDLIITVDTVFVHLAGSLNKKTFLLLNSAHDWRWLKNTNKSAWYPSVEIFRCSTIDNWPEIIKQIKNKLNEL